MLGVRGNGGEALLLGCHTRQASFLSTALTGERYVNQQTLSCIYGSHYPCM